MTAYRHWKLDRDTDGIAWLSFDKAGTSTNTLSADVFEELRAMLAELATAPPKGLVIRSAKENGFIAGAGHPTPSVARQAGIDLHRPRVDASLEIHGRDGLAAEIFSKIPDKGRFATITTNDDKKVTTIVTGGGKKN